MLESNISLINRVLWNVPLVAYVMWWFWTVISGDVDEFDGGYNEEFSTMGVCISDNFVEVGRLEREAGVLIKSW